MRLTLNIQMLRTELVEEFIADKGATLFGRAFDVSRPDGRARAAEWLAEQWEGFDSWLDQKYP